MKVFMAIPRMAFGGAEQVVIELAGGLTERGHDVTVATDQGPYRERLERAGVEWFANADTGRSLPRTAVSAARLTAAVRRARPDVLHVHGVKMTGALGIGMRIWPPRRPMVATHHGALSADHSAASRILRLADAVVCVSRDAADGLVRAGLPERLVHIVDNAISPAPALAPERARELRAELGVGDAPVAIIVGRLVEQKDHRLFLDTVAACRSDARFLIVGGGPLQAELEARAADLGIADRVSFLGFRDDVRDLWQLAAIGVFTSVWEGQSIAALEALAAGTPLVSTAVEGMRELLEGGAGVVVEGREPTELASAIDAIVHDEAELERMGRAGTQLIEARFSPARMVEHYLELYESLL